MDAIKNYAEFAGLLIESAGVAIILLGALFATCRAAWVWAHSGGVRAYQNYRMVLGKAILLGLEMLVAGDIIRTVAVEPSLSSVLTLGGIVLIRTFLSFTLEVELEGRWPWQQARHEHGGVR